MATNQDDCFPIGYNFMSRQDVESLGTLNKIFNIKLDIFYFIEETTNHMWLTEDNYSQIKYTWTSDPNKCLKFARRIDALEYCIRNKIQHFTPDIEISEHQFINKV